MKGPLFLQSAAMNTYRFSRIPLHCYEPDNAASCLTINLPGAPLGLSNLLDLTEHEILEAPGRQVHRLTFKSGEVLYVNADNHGVTVRGARVNFQCHDHRPGETFISDPASSRAAGVSL